MRGLGWSWREATWGWALKDQVIAEGLERVVRAHTERANASSTTQHQFLWPSHYYLKFLFNCKHFKFGRLHVKIKISGFSWKKLESVAALGSPGVAGMGSAYARPLGSLAGFSGPWGIWFITHPYIHTLTHHPWARIKRRCPWNGKHNQGSSPVILGWLVDWLILVPYQGRSETNDL